MTTFQEIIKDIKSLQNAGTFIDIVSRYADRTPFTYLSDEGFDWYIATSGDIEGVYYSIYFWKDSETKEIGGRFATNNDYDFAPMLEKYNRRKL